MKALFLSILMLTILAGCASQVPLATNFPVSTQKKARAVHHWDILADDVANETAKALSKSDIDPETPLFVKFSSKDSSFSSTFRKLLITKLVNKGLVVTDESKDALELNYESDIVTHSSSRYAHNPGTFTALTSGVWVARNLINGSGDILPQSLALSAAADFAAGHYAGGATSSELLVTSSISEEHIYLMRKTDIYYIEDADLSLFKPSPSADSAERVFGTTCGSAQCVSTTGNK